MKKGSIMWRNICGFNCLPRIVCPQVREEVSSILAHLSDKLSALESYDGTLLRLRTEALIGEPIAAVRHFHLLFVYLCRALVNRPRVIGLTL